MSQELLIRTYRWLRQYGLNDSHSGNASIRLNREYCITPTGACADTVTIDDLIGNPLNGRCTEGASLDAPIHQRIYQTLPKVEAVLHAHNPYTIALTLNTEVFEPVDFEGRLYFGDVPVIELDAERYHEVMPDRIAEALQNHKVAIVQSHGVYVGAESLNLAYKWVCSLEQSAKIKYLQSRL